MGFKSCNRIFFCVFMAFGTLYAGKSVSICEKKGFFPLVYDNAQNDETFLVKALKSDPLNVECMLRLVGLYLHQEGKISKGFDLLRRAYEIDPDFVEKKDISKILEPALKISILKEYAIKHSDKNSWNIIGNSFFEMGIFEEAANAYENSLNIDENQSKVRMFLALSLVNSHRTYRAIEVLRDAISHDQDNFYAYYYLGKIHKHETKEKLKADAYFKEALALLKLKKENFKKDEYKQLANELKNELGISETVMFQKRK